MDWGMLFFGFVVVGICLILCIFAMNLGEDIEREKEERRLATVLQAEHITSALSQYKDQSELINFIKMEFNAPCDRVLTVGEFEELIERCKRKVEAENQKNSINKILKDC